MAFQPAIDEPSNHRAFVEEVVIDHHQVEGHMLPLAARVGKTDVDVFDFLFFDQLVDVGCSRFLVGH